MENQEKTYEQELKELKAKWAGKRAEERKEKANEKKAEERKENGVKIEEALKALDGLTENAKKELAPAITRLNMYLSGVRYTRSKGGK